MEEKKGPGRPRNVPEKEEPNLSNTGLGIYQGSDKLWYIAVLKFDPVTGCAMISDRILAGEDKYFANELYKIKVVELEMI